MGIGYLALGGAVGSYSIARSLTWVVIGNAEWDKDESNHKGEAQPQLVHPPASCRCMHVACVGYLPPCAWDSRLFADVPVVCVWQRACMAGY